MLMGKQGERKSFLQEGMLSAEQVAEEVVNVMREERFLVLPHPEVLDYLRGKTADVDRWLDFLQAAGFAARSSDERP